ncbi:MAG TPA: hypothetical protein VFY39_16300 [Gammaproteobacteria bacterium]|nr:hypothetical protein [Gammaproteobacteria bacterium]
MSSTEGSGKLSQEARQEIERTKDKAQQLAGDAADTVKQRGREELDDVKSQAADRIDEMAKAVDSSANELDSGNGHAEISDYGHSLATFMRRMAGGLREHEIEDLTSELADYARRSPGVFLAGSVALGFGISRFLKASAHRSQSAAEDLDEEYELEFDDDYDVEGLEESDYDFDTSLQPDSPEVAPRRADEAWPADTQDLTARTASSSRPSTGPVAAPPTGPAAAPPPRSSSSSPSQGGKDHG